MSPLELLITYAGAPGEIALLLYLIWRVQRGESTTRQHGARIGKLETGSKALEHQVIELRRWRERP